ncbi:MAG: hypothetical protein SVM86_06900 [Candidatus Cloacimonadota bacterium]|nr:hypothetical protein [Candidatus Cloacimonadota bacterium]
MKKTFTGKIRLIILLIFIIIIIQGIVILSLASTIEDNQAMLMNLKNTVYIAFFLQFILILILFFYVPVFMNNSFTEIHNILKEIAKGRYNLELDMDYFKENMDKEIFKILTSIKKTLDAINTFDKLKKSKIVEHHNRINAILKLAKQGFIILDIKGNIVYMNDLVSDTIPSIIEKSNLVDTNLPPVLENNLKKYVTTVLEKKTKQDTMQFFMSDLKRHITLDSAIVRNDEGKACGAVISVANLQVEKKQKKQKDEDTVSTNKTEEN